MWCENTSFHFSLFYLEYCVFLLPGTSWTILFIHDRTRSLVDAVPPSLAIALASLLYPHIRCLLLNRGNQGGGFDAASTSAPAHKSVNSKD